MQKISWLGSFWDIYIYIYTLGASPIHSSAYQVLSRSMKRGPIALVNNRVVQLEAMIPRYGIDTP